MCASPLLWALLLAAAGGTAAYLVVVPASAPVGSAVFDAGLSGARHYRIDQKRSPSFVERLVTVERRSGRVLVKRPLRCDGLYYPNPFVLYVDSWTSSPHHIDYSSVPVRVYVVGAQCDDARRQVVADLLRHGSRSVVSVALPAAGADNRICLRRSQFVVRFRDLLPASARRCRLAYRRVSDPRFAIERAGDDVVSVRDQCLSEPLWRVVVYFRLECDAGAREAHESHVAHESHEHALMILFHRYIAEHDDMLRRIRREMSNQSPFFDRSSYVVTVPEGRERGHLVITLTAKDPEDGPLTYSMVAVRDSRSQAMFAMDTHTGTVTTRAELDRESMATHYFKVTVADGASPPRTGTTTLKITVDDANDHRPRFEQDAYAAHVRESIGIGATVLTVRATDDDVGVNADIVYAIINPQRNAAFRIDSVTGIISTRLPLDRETSGEYRLQVEASDQAAPADRRTSTVQVVITVLDDNDNYPQFSDKSYSVSVPEDLSWADSPVVTQIRATDGDAGENSEIRYALIGGNTQGHFTIDKLTGHVSVVRALDFEGIPKYRLVIRAQDGGSPSRSNTTALLVTVQDVNDNAPRFYSALFQETVQENVRQGFTIVRVQAYDSDSGANAKLRYSLQGIDVDDMPIGVDENSGWLRTTRPIDREEKHDYQFEVVATDGGEPARSASATVIITIQDQNDNDPVFAPKVYETSVSETAAPGTPVVTVSATDPDENDRLHYQITLGNEAGRFSVSAQNGRGLISLSQPLDFKLERRYVLKLSATDSDGRADSATVYINVSDANTHPPQFQHTPYTATVYEDAPAGTLALTVSAIDLDSGENARVTYAITGEPVPEFTVNPTTGEVTTTRRLDRERASGYLLTVSARDNGHPPMSDTTDIELFVADVNDNAPAFAQPGYQASVSEAAVVGTSVVTLSAADADHGLNGRVRYTFAGGADGDGAFSVDATSGIVRTSQPLDRETVAQYALVALAVDQGSPALTATVRIAVDIDDVNDSPPVFEDGPVQLFVAENSPVGSLVGRIRAHDPDAGANAFIQYSMMNTADSPGFELRSEPMSQVAELFTRRELDYESDKKVYMLLVLAQSPPLQSYVNVEVNVNDVNDNAPTLSDFKIIFNNFENHFPTRPIGRVPVVELDATDQLTFTVRSGNNANLLLINSTTGDITLSPSLNTNVAITASMEVSVTDGLNEVSAVLELQVRMVTREMLYNSVTVRLDEMTSTAFLSPNLFSLFKDGLAAVLSVHRQQIVIFNVQDDTEVKTRILNVSFSALLPDSGGYLSQQHIQEQVYLNRALLAKLAAVQVLPFEDNLCVREPCLNFQRCLTVLKFGNATGFLQSSSVLFRPIYPVQTFACKCPSDSAGMSVSYECDVEVDLCYSQPCQNGGKCRSKEGGYTCGCPLDFTGDNCQHDMRRGSCPAHADVCRGSSVCAPLKRGGFLCDNCTSSPYYTGLCQLTARSFSIGSFLTFRAMKQRHRFHIQLKFATRSRNGLLLYNGRYNERHDFIALEVVDADVRFSFSVGNKISHVTGRVPGGVSDGGWHQVEVIYRNREATIVMDGCDSALALKGAAGLDGYRCANRTTMKLEDRCAGFKEWCQRFVDLTGPLQIGGLPSLPTKFRVTSQHFSGCIRDVFIDHELLDLNRYVANNNTLAGCPEKQEFCRMRPCQHGGTCFEGWGTYVCRCQDGYAGKDCSLSAELPRRLQGDGFVSYISRIDKIDVPWFSGLSFRTRAPGALLMRITFGDGIATLLLLQEGYIEYQYQSEVLRLDTVRVNDGRWHHVLVKWMANAVWIELDYGNHELTVPGDAQLTGRYVDVVTVGGADSEHLPAPNLIGCVRDVRVGNWPNSSLTIEDDMRAVRGCSLANTCEADSCPDHSMCHDTWGRHECACQPGYVGDQCTHVCRLTPCQNNATCTLDMNSPRGYTCNCTSELTYGTYCESRIAQPCPSKWWGYPVCGPCDCDTKNGYDSNCDKKTGQCRCKPYHYRPPGSKVCFPCACYITGSFSRACDQLTGQCRCKNGVIGRRCDSCSHPFAEVTNQLGCQVVYTGCPRTHAAGVLWQQTTFDLMAVQACPRGAVGEAKRACDRETGWAEPDLSECRSVELQNQEYMVRNLTAGTVVLTPLLAVKTAADMLEAAASVDDLYVTDIYFIYKLLCLLLQHENSEAGLNLSHRQDKDFIPNILEATSIILQPKYKRHWENIQSQTKEGASNLLENFDQYAHTLVRTQQDTFTDPMEISTENVVLGLDTISWRQIHGSVVDGRVDLPAHTAFLDGSLGAPIGPAVALPKHNNYPRNRLAWDDHNKAVVPLSLLGIDALDADETAGRPGRQRAVVAYVLFRTLPALLPAEYASNVRLRWGVGVSGQSAMLTLAVHTDAGALAADMDVPVRLQLRTVRLSAKSNPQCVRWQHHADGSGFWTRQSCQTEYLEPWEYNNNFTYVNCTCSHLSSFAVLMDDPSAEYLIETSPAENIVTYIGLLASIVLLLLSFLIFSLLRGGLQTNSNSIHKNLAFCLFSAQLIFLTALKLRQEFVVQEFPCKMVAILLHYLWLSAFSWLLLESVHVHRMLTEMRDVNHGAMRFYYSLGYGVPAIIVGLAVGVRADQYGNIYFCWLSIHESVIWAMVGPVFVLITATLVNLVLAIRASLSLKDHVEGFGNLRTLLWLAVALLPLMGAVWVLAVLSVSEELEVVNYLLAGFSLLLGLYLLLGYCLLNRRVRQGSARSLALCCGRKPPYEESLAGTRTTMASRSALSYHHDDILRRNVGISTSSTTSRSTCKTSSSPYSMGINAPSTTSNSQPASSAHDSRPAGGSRHGRSRRARRRRDSDSESDDSAARRSLSLASSHSSDEEDAANGAVPQLRVEERAHPGQNGQLGMAGPPAGLSWMSQAGGDRLSTTTASDAEAAGALPSAMATLPAHRAAADQWRPERRAHSPALLSRQPPGLPPGLPARAAGLLESRRATPPVIDESPEALPEPAPDVYAPDRLADLQANPHLPVMPLDVDGDSELAQIAPSYV